MSLSSLNGMESTDIRTLARRRLQAQAEFKNYLLVYAGVTLIVVAVWFLTNPSAYFWPAWVIFGMGIGAAFKAFEAYGPRGRALDDSAVDAEVRRFEGRQ